MPAKCINCPHDMHFNKCPDCLCEPLYVKESSTFAPPEAEGKLPCGMQINDCMRHHDLNGNHVATPSALPTADCKCFTKDNLLFTYECYIHGEAEPPEAQPQESELRSTERPTVDTDSRQADILGQAYDYGHHNKLDGCLVPLLEELNQLLAAEYTRGAREELEALNQKTVRLQKREWRKDETPGYVVPVEAIEDRLQQLTKEPK